MTDHAPRRFSDTYRLDDIRPTDEHPVTASVLVAGKPRLLGLVGHMTLVVVRQLNPIWCLGSCDYKTIARKRRYCYGSITFSALDEDLFATLFSHTDLQQFGIAPIDRCIGAENLSYGSRAHDPTGLYWRQHAPMQIEYTTPTGHTARVVDLFLGHPAEPDTPVTTYDYLADAWASDPILKEHA